MPHSDNTWHHLVVQRRTNTLQVWFDGTESTTGPVAITVELTAAAITGTIGASQATTSVEQEFEGYIDEVRVTKGVARFTEDFTVPTVEYPAKANVAWEWSAATLYLQDFRRSS